MADDTHKLLILEDENLAAGIDWLKKNGRRFSGIVLMGTQRGFPFKPCPSRILTPQLPNHLIAACPLLEDWVC